MKRFKFRLQRVLKLREDAEQRQAAALGEALHEERVLDTICAEEKARLDQISEQLAPKPGELRSAGMLQVLGLTAQAANTRLSAAEDSRHKAQKAVANERELLSAARVERKTLERLKDQQHGAWTEAIGRDEQKTTDEIALRKREEPGSGR
ncbi:MAG: flagellar export protein FliJ [Gemmatimonadota bacterium]